jgi:DNA-binding CsgD family transcriptional regulator
MSVHLVAVDGEVFALVRAPDPRTMDTLSAAEREVARLAASGLSNAAIAKARGSSKATVVNQLGEVYRKLRIRGRRDLIARAAARW